jgi:hypothetical protein
MTNFTTFRFTLNKILTEVLSPSLFFPIRNMIASMAKTTNGNTGESLLNILLSGLLHSTSPDCQANDLDHHPDPNPNKASTFSTLPPGSFRYHKILTLK